MEPNKEVSQPQTGTQQSNIHRKKMILLQKLGKGKLTEYMTAVLLII